MLRRFGNNTLEFIRSLPQLKPFLNGFSVIRFVSKYARVSINIDNGLRTIEVYLTEAGERLFEQCRSLLPDQDTIRMLDIITIFGLLRQIEQLLSKASRSVRNAILECLQLLHDIVSVLQVEMR